MHHQNIRPAGADIFLPQYRRRCHITQNRHGFIGHICVITLLTLAAKSAKVSIVNSRRKGAERSRAMRQFTAMKNYHSARGFYYAYEARYAGYPYAARTLHGC
ncbi:MAG: hypothetical protein IJS55_05480 [Oscillospiraceae bacterium]|nr:hypothetical protein [Oscillospiraceae bacterium]